MEFNDEKELETFLSSEPEHRDPEEEKEVEEREIEPQETPEEEEEVAEQPVEALTDREAALIAQFTESPEASDDSFDPSAIPTQEWTPQEYSFLKEGESLDDILSDPVKFNAKITQLYNDALQRGAQLALEATYRNLPRTVSTYAKQQIDTVNLVNDFYQQNKDLIPIKPALARIAQKIGTEHPEYTLNQLLTESAKAARTIFKMKKEQPAKGAPKRTPAFVQQKGGNNRVNSGRNTGTKSLEDEVIDLIR